MEENMVNNDGLSDGENVTDSEKETGEKLFTQEQVNEIIKKRLGRQKEENANVQELETRAAELTKRESRLSCKEYVLKKGYPAELLDIIDTSDVDTFKQKADKASNIFSNQRESFVAPLASAEPNMIGGSVFPADTKHTPRGYWATDPRLGE